MGKKNVVIAGAGKIGRGYLAELFQEGGYHTTFLVHSPKKTEQLRAQGSYIIFRGNKEETAVEEVMISASYCGISNSVLYLSSFSVRSSG